MTHYSYLALNKEHQRHNGIVEAESEVQARTQLQQQGFTPLSLVELAAPIEDESSAQQQSSDQPNVSDSEISAAPEEAAEELPSSLYVYRFEGVRANGQPASGSIEAVNERVAEKTLEEEYGVSNIRLQIQGGDGQKRSLTRDPARAFMRPQVRIEEQESAQESETPAEQSDQQSAVAQDDVLIDHYFDPPTMSGFQHAPSEQVETSLQAAATVQQSMSTPLQPTVSQILEPEGVTTHSSSERSAVAMMVEEIRVIFGVMLASFITYMVISLAYVLLSSGNGSVRQFAWDVVTSPLSHLILVGFFTAYAVLTVMVRKKLYSPIHLLMGAGICMLGVLLVLITQ